MARNTINKELIQGRNMMLFKPNGESYAYCISNRLVISTTTSNISTKDHGQWNALSADKYNWSVSSEYLTTDEFDTLFNAMITNELVLVKFGEKIEDDPDKTVVDGDYKAWHLNGAKTYYQGYAVITNIEQTAANSEIAQFTIEMQGIGKLIAKDDLITVSTVDAQHFESFPFSFSWGVWEGLEDQNLVTIGWDDNVMSSHSAWPNNVAYFIPKYNFNLDVKSKIPNTKKMEITFHFIHEFDEEFDITLTYNGEVNTVHIPTSGTRYTLNLNGGDNTITMESNSFPDIRITVTEIKTYYIEDNN